MKKEVPLGKRKMYDDEFKARVALEATKGEKTIAQVSAEYKVHPNQVLKWKKHLQENVAGIFSRKKDPRMAEQEELIEQLYKKIGQEEIELEFLKKKYKQMQSQ